MKDIFRKSSKEQKSFSASTRCQSAIHTTFVVALLLVVATNNGFIKNVNVDH